MIPIDRQILKKMTVYYPDGTPLEISNYLTNVNIDYGDTTGIGVSGADGVVPIMSFGLKNDTDYRFNPLDKTSPVNLLSDVYTPLLWENRQVLFEARILDNRQDINYEYIGTGDGLTKSFTLDHFPIPDPRNLWVESVAFWTYSEWENVTYDQLAQKSWYKEKSKPKFTFSNTTGEITFVDPIPSGNGIISPYYSYWANDTGWKKRFRGFLGDDIQNTVDGVSCTCRSESKLLQDCFIETEREYGSSAGVAAEAVIQSIINDNLGEGVITLYCPVSPGFMVTEYTLSYQSVWDAIQAVAGQFGWFLGDYYDSATNDWYLTLIEPPRTKDSTTADLTLNYRTDIKVEELNITGKNIRNVVNVVYRDFTSGTRSTVTVTDNDSITAYGRRATTFEESDTSLIDTEAEATTFANAALSDLSSLTGAYRVLMPILFDVNLFTGMVVNHPRIHTDNQFFAVASMRESYNFGDSPLFEMESLGSGRVTGGTRRWLNRETRPGANNPQLRSPIGTLPTVNGLMTSSGTMLIDNEGKVNADTAGRAETSKSADTANTANTANTATNADNIGNLSKDAQGRTVDSTGAVIADSGGFNGKVIAYGRYPITNESDTLNLENAVIPTGKIWIVIVSASNQYKLPSSNGGKTLKDIIFLNMDFYGSFSSGGLNILGAGTYNDLTCTIYHRTVARYHYTDFVQEDVTAKSECYYEIKEINA